MQETPSICNKQLFLVTGKGGVGKSTIAAALAYRLSLENHLTKLIELDLDSYFSKLFAVEPSWDGVKLKENLQLSRWTGMDCLSEYVDHLIKLRGMGKIFFDNPVMSKLLNIAPGLFELAILGKFTAGPRKHGPMDKSDKLVLDSFATGHSLSMLMAPKVMAESVKIGPMHDQSAGIVKVLQSEISQIVVVSTPELMAVEESLELASKLFENFGIRPFFILNRCMKEFDELPQLDNQWDKYLFSKASELEKVRKLIAKEGYRYWESPFVVNATDSWSLLEKVSADWSL